MEKEYTNNKTIYCYQLTTGTVIKSNGKFQFESTGKSLEEHSGTIDGKFAEKIKFYLEYVIIAWEE